MALLAVLVLAACGDGGSSGAPSGAGVSSGALDARVERFTVNSANHVNGQVNYAQTPPVGGDHNAAWLNCGYYPQAVIVEMAVHSMEHGAVWVTYRPSLPSDQVDILRAFARSNRYVLVSPWADDTLPAPVVASAWGLQVQAGTAEDPVVAAFVETYANGPQTPEPGAPCSGGVGSPS